MNTTSEPDLSARLEFIIDNSAEPADWDEAVADFLIAFYRSTPDASGGEDRNFHEALEGVRASRR